MHRPITQPFIIRRSRMVETTIVPNGHVAHIHPLVPYLHIVVLEDQVQEPVHQRLRLERGDVVDVADVLTDRVDGLPARHRVGANDWMGGGQLFAHIERRPAWGGIEREFASLGRLMELRLGAMHRQGFEKALNGGRDAVIELVARCPDGIYVRASHSQLLR